MNLKNRFRVAVSLGTLVLAGTGFVACGGDDTTIGGSEDAGTDGTVPGDGGQVDGSTDGAADAGDGSSDGSPGSDGSTDGGDAGDAGDGGDSGEGGPSETATLQTFQHALANAYCTQFAKACTAADAGAVDIAVCIDMNTRGPAPILQGSTAGFSDTNATSRNDTLYNATQARLCLQEIEALDFGNLQASSYAQASKDCFTVVKGTLPAGAGCFESIECASSLYCKQGTYDAGVADGGDAGPTPTGTCSTLEDAGTDCSSYPAGDSCAYLGVPGVAFCDYSTTNLTSTDITCQNVLSGIGDYCGHDDNCASGLCDPHATQCVTATSNYVDTTFCGSYPAPDAGH
jgi:hypothetical protein